MKLTDNSPSELLSYNFSFGHLFSAESESRAQPVRHNVDVMIDQPSTLEIEEEAQVGTVKQVSNSTQGIT